MITSTIQMALERQGVFMQIITADSHFQTFMPFSLNDDPQQDHETIANLLIMELFKFLIEDGFYMSSDNKSLLGRLS
jgi:hypothetical protein